MKRIILIFIFVIAVINASADGIKISSFSINTTDLSARTEPRMDNNGKNCALIKVQCPVDRLSFDGNVRGDVKYENSVYWVYMDKDSGFLLIKMSNGDPLLITFSDYLEATTLESNTTYDLQIVIDKYDYNKVYNPRMNGSANGHDYVDLGLSVYWATCNVGSNKPSENGGRFAWGETSAKRRFSLENYKFYTGDEYERYTNYKLGDDYSANNHILKPADDAASANWGGEWRIPSKDELIELYTSCTCYWTTFDGTPGIVLTGPNGNSIFLPYATSDETVEVREKTYGHDVYGEDYKKLAVVRKTKVAKYISSFTSTFLLGHSVLTLRFTDQLDPKFKEMTDHQDWDTEYQISPDFREEGFSIRPVLPKQE